MFTRHNKARSICPERFSAQLWRLPKGNKIGISEKKWWLCSFKPYKALNSLRPTRYSLFVATISATSALATNLNAIPVRIRPIQACLPELAPGHSLLIKGIKAETLKHDFRI